MSWDRVKVPKTVTLSPEDGLRIPILLQIEDDDVAGVGECATLALVKAVGGHLYRLDLDKSSTRICIQDNDGESSHSDQWLICPPETEQQTVLMSINSREA